MFRLTFRQVILVILFIISLFVLVRVAFPRIEKQSLWGDDYDTYWLSGRLFLRGENPYSLNAIQSLKNETGLEIKLDDGVPVYPPWSIPLMAFIGLFDYQTGRVLLIIINVTIVFICTNFFWDAFRGPVSFRWLAYFVTLLFAPTMFVIGRSQTSLLILLGVVGILYFLRDRHCDWFAGASILLVIIKPHISYLFLLALFLWAVRNHRWGILLGGAIAPIALLVLVMPINPDLIWQFLSLQQPNYNQLDWLTPTTGIFLRSVIGYENVWLQFIPPSVGLAWFAWYYSTRKANWDWIIETPRLLLVSAITALFIWTYDQVILIPIILLGTVVLLSLRQQWVKFLLVTLVISFSVVTLWLHRSHDDSWFVWFSPGVLLWYLFVHYIGRRTPI